METILFHTDAPDILLARDEFGARYLCHLVALDRDGHQFLAINISEGRLADLKLGAIDLRAALVQPERRVYYKGHVPPGERLAIHLDQIDDVPSDWWPEPGFLLSNFIDDVPDEQVVKDAVSKNSAVIVCGMNPPEAMGEVPKVDADRLAKYISAFQELVAQAGRRALNRLSAADKRNNHDPATLQVFAFSPGSFRIHFSSKSGADLFGQSVVGEAMRHIDELMEVSSRPVEQIAAGLVPYKGATLSAYHHLLKFIDKGETAFSYRWSDPAMGESSGFKITRESARAIAAILEAETTLTSEPLTFSGRFTSVNTERAPYSWTARDGEDKKVNGHIHKDAPGVLNDVRIRTQQYVFDCERSLVTTPSGDPAWKMYLKSVSPKE